jgi:hypothetical protein
VDEELAPVARRSEHHIGVVAHVEQLRHAIGQQIIDIEPPRRRPAGHLALRSGPSPPPRWASLATTGGEKARDQAPTASPASLPAD